MRADPTKPTVITFRTWHDLADLSIVHSFMSIGQGVTGRRGPKIAYSHRKAESSIILHLTTVHVLIIFSLLHAPTLQSDYFPITVIVCPSVLSTFWFCVSPNKF
jgi:hypothetical protein